MDLMLGGNPADADAASGTKRPAIDISALIDKSSMSKLQLRVILLCTVVAAFEGYDLQAVAFVAPVLSDEFGIDAGAMGLLFGAFLVGMAFGNAFIGSVADRLGRRKILIASLLAYGACVVATGFSDSLTTLLIVRFLTGVGMGGAGPVYVALASEYSPRRSRSTALMCVLTGIPAGAIVGGLIAAWIVPAFGWQSVFFVGGALPLVAAVLFVPTLPESIRFLASQPDAAKRIRPLAERIAPQQQFTADSQFTVQGETSPGGIRLPALFQDGRAAMTLLIWLALFSIQFMAYFLLSWTPTLLIDAGIPLSTAILGATVISIGGLVGSILLGVLSDSLRRPVLVLCVACAISIPAVVLLPMTLASIVWSFALIFILGGAELVKGVESIGC